MFQGKLPLTGINVNRLEDTDTIKNAFEISGPLIERITAVCQGPNEANKWVELLSPDPIASFKPKSNESLKNMSSSAMSSPIHVSYSIHFYCIELYIYKKYRFYFFCIELYILNNKSQKMVKFILRCIFIHTIIKNRKKIYSIYVVIVPAHRCVFTVLACQIIK